jgi:hypothetical protein
MMFYTVFADNVVRGAKLRESFTFAGDYAAMTFANLMVIVIAVCVLAFTTHWVAGRKLIGLTATIFATLAVMFAIFPGGVALLNNYMRVMRLGGEAPVVVSVDPHVAKLWPEFFDLEISTNADTPVRSGQLSLLLMGKEQIFLKHVQNDTTSASGTLMLNRSLIKEVMFPSAVQRPIPSANSTSSNQ